MSEKEDKLAFISYSSRDSRFVRKLVRDLVAGGIAVWVDKEQITPGDSITEKLAAGIGKCTDLLIVLSEHFLASRWCKTELKTVLHKQITENGRQILPLQIGVLPNACWNEFPLIFIEDVLRIDMSGRNYRRGLASLLSALGKPSIEAARCQSPGEAPQVLSLASSGLGPEHSNHATAKPECDRKGPSQKAASRPTAGEAVQTATDPDPDKDRQYGTRFIENELPHIVRRVAKEGIIPAVVFIDVDNLTAINKVYGWEVGNTVLDVVCEIVRRRSFAKAKYKGRCGDDTFYSVLFESAKAREYCERLRADVSGYPWQSTCPNLHVSCTIGYATFKANEHPYDWLARAIQGMLEGKKEGPNTLRVGPQFSGLKFEKASSGAQPPPLPANFPRVVYESATPRTDFSLRDFFS